MKAPSLARRRFLLSVVVALSCLSAEISRGQGLLGLTFLPGESTVTVVSIDQTNGALTPLVPTTATGIAGGHIAFDPATRRVFFEDSASLYIADLRQGVSSSTPMPLCCPPLQFDVTTNQLLGLTFLPGETTVTVVSIDPATAAVTPLLPTTATGITGGHIAFDPATRRVFFEDSTSLYVADLRQGVVSSTPMALCCPPLQFDVTTNQLLGVTFLPGETTATVISIDPATGAETPLLPTTSTGFIGGYITFDPSTRRLFFIEPTDGLHIADLRQGVASITPMPHCCPVLEFATGGQVATVPVLGWPALLILTSALLLVGWKLAGFPNS